MPLLCHPELLAALDFGNIIADNFDSLSILRILTRWKSHVGGACLVPPAMQSLTARMMALCKGEGTIFDVYAKFVLVRCAVNAPRPVQWPTATEARQLAASSRRTAAPFLPAASLLSAALCSNHLRCIFTILPPRHQSHEAHFDAT